MIYRLGQSPRRHEGLEEKACKGEGEGERKDRGVGGRGVEEVGRDLSSEQPPASESSF